MVRMLNLGNAPKLPEQEEQSTIASALGEKVDSSVHTVPIVEVSPQGETEGQVEPLSRVVNEKVGKPVGEVKPLPKEEVSKPKQTDVSGSDEVDAPRAGGISLVGIIQSNLDTVTVFTRGVYKPATRIVGYILRNDGVEELEVFEDKLVLQSNRKSIYQPNTSLLSTAENPSSVKRVPFAIGEERLFTKPGLIALAETCKEIGYSLGVGEALGVIVQQLTELHPELTEELATEIAKDFTFKIEVKDARSEGILVPDNPEGIFSKVSVALGLRISAKTVKLDVARKLVEHNLVQGKTPEEVLLMLKDRLNLSVPQGLLLPKSLFADTHEVKGVPIASEGSKVKPEYELVFGVYNEYTTPKSSPKSVAKEVKPKAKGSKHKSTGAQTTQQVSSQVNLAKYFAHYTQGE